MFRHKKVNVTETVTTDRKENVDRAEKVHKFEIGNNLNYTTKWLAAGTFITFLSISTCKSCKEYCIEEDKRSVEQTKIEALKDAGIFNKLTTDSLLDKNIKIVDSFIKSGR